MEASPNPQTILQAAAEGGCNAFAEGLIYVDGSWLVLGILSLGMVFARLRKDRCPYLVLSGTFSGPTDRVNQDHPALS